MNGKKILVEGSGRHIHVTAADLAILCGDGFELEVKRYLSQPGEFASLTRLGVAGPRGTLKTVTVLGPYRGATQVELSLTDALSIGLTPPIRQSGDLAGSVGCTLIGPAGSLDLKEGVIVAKRHVHLTPHDAEAWGIKDNQIIQVRIEGPQMARPLIFDEVVARVSPNYTTCMHIDYDEMNAAGLPRGGIGEILVGSDYITKAEEEEPEA